MKKLAILAAILALTAASAEAQGVRWDRTAYPGNCTKQFHVVTSAAGGYYTDLVSKYGGDNVLKFSGQGVLDTIEGNISTGDVACILFYPGTYTFTDVWTVAKPVQIMSASGNPSDVNLDGDTNNCDIISFADGSDGSSIRNVRMTLDNANSAEEDAITIGSGADDIVVDRVVFIGSSTASTDAQGVFSLGNRVRVTNCFFSDVSEASGAIKIVGTDNYIAHNVFVGTKANQLAIEANGTSNTANATLRAVIEDNTISFTAASSDVGIKTASNALNNVYVNNKIYAADPISSGTDNTTLHLFGNITSNTTTAAWITN